MLLDSIKSELEDKPYTCDVNRQVKMSDIGNIGKALDDGWVITFPQGTTTPFKPIRKGTAHIIKKYNPIFIIEISKYNINKMNSNLKFFTEFLLENDYLIIDLYQNKVEISEIKKRITDVDKDHKTIGNFYLVKNNHYLDFFFK